MVTIQDAERDAYKQELSSDSDNRIDLRKEFLSKAVNEYDGDGWLDFFKEQGIDTDNVNDAWNLFLKGLGYTGTVPDMRRQFFIDGSITITLNTVLSNAGTGGETGTNWTNESNITTDANEASIFSTFSSMADNNVRLRKASGAVGDNKALAGNYTSTETTVSYGGSNDLWGTTWTPAEINASTFGVGLQVTGSATSVLTGTNYGFSIPTDATIKGIYVEITRRAVANDFPELFGTTGYVKTMKIKVYYTV